MKALRSLLFNIATFSWTIGATITLLTFAVLFAKPRSVQGLGEMWSGVIFKMLRVICSIDYEARGMENLPAGPCIVAAKHQSAWDTMIFLHLLDYPSYVLKRELTLLPIIGKAMRRVGMVAVDRKGGASALKRMVADARRCVDQGRSIIIFPEGTRVAPGVQLDYHPGVAALYQSLKLPVVPVGLNSGLFWGRRSFIKNPGRILLEFLPPIPPGLPRREFMVRLQEQVEKSTNRLIAESAS